MKNKDLSYLYVLINKKQKDYNNVFEHKQYIKSELHKMYDNHYPISNINSIYKNKGQYNYNFEYQRYDAKLEYKDFVKTFYDVNYPSKVIFTNCGMSSIYSVLQSLKTNKYNGIKYQNDTYFETQKNIKMLKFRKSNTIIYLDTISNNFNFKCSYKNKIIVIDTTCYHPSSFKKLIKEIIDNNNLCILVRSHTKLDMLGLEYSTLGSITYLFSPNIDSKRFLKYKNIIKTNIEICSNIGLFATEYNIFPFLNDKRTIQHNKNRVERIRTNNSYFYSMLKGNYPIKLYNHRLFSTIETNKDIKELKNIVKNFTSKNNKICKYSPSFGFDYIAIDTYIDLNTKNNTIRISVGDVTKKEIDRFIKEFTNAKI